MPDTRNLLVSKSGKVAITNINQGALRAVPVPVPPASEQQRIIHTFSTIDRKIRIEENRKQALRILFKTLLHNLMTGKVRVKDLDLTEVEEMV